MRLPLLLGAVGIGSLAVVHLRDPHSSGSYGYCPFNYLTGMWCPGCGGLRAVNDLTNLDFAAAVSSNVLAVALVAAVGLAYLWWLPKRLSGLRVPLVSLSSRVVYASAAVIVVFTVLRNTPWGAGLAP